MNATDFYVLGNGRSLKDFNFESLKEKHWIGCCLAYRYWEKVDIWPTYYVNVDHVVLKHNEKEIRNMIETKKCGGFLISRSVMEAWKDFDQGDNVFFIEDLLRNGLSLFKNCKTFCSGSVAAMFACDIAKNVHLLGFDCDYVEVIPECTKEVDGTLTIKKTPDYNPNYFFDDYQREGDNYNIPNGKTVHLRSWEELRYILDFTAIMFDHTFNVTNYNDKKSISEFFKTKELKELSL